MDQGLNPLICFGTVSTMQSMVRDGAVAGFIRDFLSSGCHSVGADY